MTTRTSPLIGLRVCVALALLHAFPSLGAVTRYVRPINAGAQHPYTNWATAATNIQQAVNACAAGDTVQVSNGYYWIASQI